MTPDPTKCNHTARKLKTKIQNPNTSYSLKEEKKTIYSSKSVPKKTTHKSLIKDVTSNNSVRTMESNASTSRITNNNIFLDEDNRLTTFKDWPNPNVKPENLARAGFYYTRMNDRVRCPFCKLELAEWEKDDDPKEMHRKHSPNCPFVNPSRLRSVDETDGRIQCDSFKTMNFDPEQANSVPEHACANSGDNAQAVGVNLSNPKYPKYATLASRLASYKYWPAAMKQRPQELSECGLFYTGKGDRTMCFYCAGGLMDWEENDDPWTEHAKWSGDCEYLILQKGRTYIQEAQYVVRGATSSTEKELEQDKEGRRTEKINQNVKNKEEELPKTKQEEKQKANGISGNLSKNNEGKSSNERTMCKICMSKEMSVVFLPCSHLVACVDCAPALTTCAVCRKPIDSWIKIYF